MGITDRIVTVTPAMAEEWLSHNLWNRQRKRAEWQVDRLAIEMEKGRFTPGTQIHFGVLNGDPKLVNGQHTLGAIVKYGAPIQLSVLYTDVADEKELGALYGRHDRHRGRTPHDAFLAAGLSHELNLSEQEVNSFGSGLKFVLMDFRRPSVNLDVEISASVDRLADEMRQWQPAAGMYFEAVREARHGMRGTYRRAPVVAVGLVTFQHQPSLATEFWAGAAGDDALGRNDPRRALNSFLATSTSGHGDPINYMRAVANAWNKFYDRDDLQFLRPGDQGRMGITIKGTPYKSKKRDGRVPATMQPESLLPAEAGDEALMKEVLGAFAP